jgi:hypothetical protein
MLVDRRLFLELGGFDEAFFALLEDVDFGWRLRLAGHDVRLAARSRSMHRHNATVSRLPSAQRRFLYERNALRMLLKNLDDRNVGQVLAAALLLLAKRSALEAAAPPPDADAGDIEVPASAFAPIQAVAAVLDDLESLLAERERVQALRRRSDAAVLPLFGRPFMATDSDDGYIEAVAHVVRLFGLEDVFAGARVGDGTLQQVEPLSQLLAKWRLEYGVDRSALWHLRRAVWQSMPRRVRIRFRPTTDST